MEPSLQQLADNLSRLATHHDITGIWPEASLAELGSAGAWQWVIPAAYGGLGLDQVQLTQAYEAVAAGCMTTLLILTQRDRACELIADGENDSLKAGLLPRLVRNEVLATVGISQVTTSRQGARPALAAAPDGAGFMLNGVMPWVTSAARSDLIVTAALLPDGRQLLAAVDTRAPGVTIDKPMDLMALQASHTCEVHCRNVRVPPERVIRGPAANALSSGMTIRPHVVAAAGVGLAGSMAVFIAAHSGSADGALRTLAEEIQHRCDAMRERLYRVTQQAMSRATPLAGAAGSVDEPAGAADEKTDLRVAVNDLLVRVAAAALVYGKGTGLLRQMPVQRLAREAMFFLVWSASTDVRVGTVARLLEEPPPEVRSLSID